MSELSVLPSLYRAGLSGPQRERRASVPGKGDLAGLLAMNHALDDGRRAVVQPQAQSEFLASMCHEIRNPVSVMIGIMELTLQTELSAEQREYLSLMKASGTTLLGIVNNTLDLARIEAGCIEAERIPFSLRERLGDTVRLLALAAREKGLTLHCEIDPEIPDALLGDPLRLHQIVSNLLGNAIKFTDYGAVVMRVGHECSAGEIVCRFSISDTGIGIARDKQARIFEPFLQAETATCRKYGGSGLGLAISARLVQMLNGRIWLESAPGKGSTFFFTASFSPQDKAQENAPAQAIAPESGTSRSGGNHSQPKKSILVVDDNPLSRRLTQLVLEKEGYRVTLADGGAAALDLLEGEPPDLVLMDLQMPEMNGAQTTQAIRRHEAASGRHLPIVALTADPLPAAYQYSLQAGMDGCLIKPVQPALLREFIDCLHVLAAGHAAPEAAACVVLDRQVLLEQVNGDAQLLAEVSDLFFDHCDCLMADAHEKMRGRDKAGFAHALHTLLGMFRSLAAIAAQKTTEKLQGRSLECEADQVAVLYRRLEADVWALKAALVSLRNEMGKAIHRNGHARRGENCI
jgi:signal transduction histidine kinase/FixJ family two-component response regulator